MSSRGIRLAMLASLTLAISGSRSRAETAYDHFNDYGETRVDLLGNVGSETAGWAGPWENNGSPDYHPGVQLTYDDPNYSNEPNASDANDGAAGVNDGGGVNSGQVGTRSFATPLTGTVWVSALVQYTTSDQNFTEIGETLFWFDENVDPAGSDFIAIRRSGSDGLGTLRYNETNQSTTETFAIDTTHLLLAKIQLDVGGNNDSIDFWINPDLAGGEAGIGAADLSASGVDTFGPALDSIGVSFAYNGSYIDAIRVSNDADGFAKVISPSIAPPLAGDFDEDGDVDGDDLAEWKAGFGTPTDATHMQGDADGDEDVDGADFLIWQRQVGSGAPPEVNAAAVPEPAGLVLLGLGLIGSWLTRRQRA